MNQAFRDAYDPTLPEEAKVALWAEHARPWGDDIHPDYRQNSGGPEDPPAG